MKTLRPYQESAVTSTLKFLFEKKGHPLVVAPVGAGKSLIIAEIVKRLHDLYPQLKVLMLTHVKELIVQNAEELKEQYPDCDTGIYCAGLDSKDRRSSVTYATIQSMAGNLVKLNKPPEIIIVDECQLISHNEDTQYRQLINDTLELNPNCRVVGLTGTPFRADTGRLDRGENKIFDEVCYEISMAYMIEQGYWAKPVSPEVQTRMDTTNVSIRGGDYVAKQLQEALDSPDLTKACVDETIRLAGDRKKWLIFAAGIKHAEDVCNALIENGVSARFLIGEQSAEYREETIQLFKSGEIKCLVNVAILTTGFNVPDIDMISFMRPTRSPVLYIQMIGRGVRPVYAVGYDLSTQEGRLNAIAASVKPDCMVLDFGNVVKELGAIDTINIEKEHHIAEEKERDGEAEAVFKICPSCSHECAPAQRECSNCGYQFLNIEKKAAYGQALISTDNKPEWVDVMQVFYKQHNKEGSVPSLRVGYSTIEGVINEWVCFEHHTFGNESKKIFAWNKACEWHWERMPDKKPPTTIVDAINMKYPNPKRIKVMKKGKYFTILDYDFREKKEDTFIDELEHFEIPF